MVKLLLIGISIFVGFLVQSVLGFAATIVTAPMLTGFFGIKYAISFMSIFLLLFSIVMVYVNRKFINRRAVFELSIGSFFGVILGVYILQYGDPLILNKLLGFFILFYVIYHMASKKKIKKISGFGWVFGFFGGIFSGLFSSGGPFIVTYLHNRLDNQNVIRGSVIGVLAISNVLRFILLLHGGLITSSMIPQALFSLPFFIAALVLGQFLYKKINAKLFERLIMIFLVLTSLSLIF